MSIAVRYEGHDRFEIGIRGHRVTVDQPADAGGDDAGPTPTELFVASLAGCVGFYAERFLRRHDLPVDGLEVRSDYEMSEDPPARVASVQIEVVTPTRLLPTRNEALRRVVEHCTVHNTIRLAPDIRVSFAARERAA